MGDAVLRTRVVGDRDLPVGTTAATTMKGLYRRRPFAVRTIPQPKLASVHVISSDSNPKPRIPSHSFSKPRLPDPHVVVSFPKPRLLDLNIASQPKPKRRRIDRSFVSKVENSHGSSWVRVGLLGKGAFGCVSLAKRTSNEDDDENEKEPGMLAVKSAPLDECFTLQREKDILHYLRCFPYIVSCYGDEITHDSDGHEVYNLLLEYCSGMSLYSRLKSVTRMGEHEVGSYTHDVLMGLLYMHQRGFVHCDIKPDNILLVPKHRRPCGFYAKIADFGLTKHLEDGVDDEGLGVVRGTCRYMSPELVKHQMMGSHVDIWALGCTALEMLTGKCPWDSENDKEAIMSLIGDSNQVPFIPDFVSPTAREFLCLCLRRNPASRLKACVLINHPFLICSCDL